MVGSLAQKHTIHHEGPPRPLIVERGGLDEEEEHSPEVLHTESAPSDESIAEEESHAGEREARRQQEAEEIGVLKKRLLAVPDAVPLSPRALARRLVPSKRVDVGDRYAA